TAPDPPEHGCGEQGNKSQENHRDQNNEEVRHPDLGSEEQEPERRNIEPKCALRPDPQERRDDEYHEKGRPGEPPEPVELPSHHHRASYALLPRSCCVVSRNSSTR